MNESTAFPLADALTRRTLESVDAIRAGETNSLIDAVTPVTAELLRYWFQDDYCELRRLNFHKGQLAAILNTIYAHEVVGGANLSDLYRDVAPEALLQPGLNADVSHPRQSHPKYAAKLATGTGKTWVLNALLVWQQLNAIANPLDHRFSRNFLVVAPGLIVYDRLLDSFLGKEVNGHREFELSDLYLNKDLFVPDDYREMVFAFVHGAVARKEEIGRKATSGGLIAVTNWHLLTGDEDPDFLPEYETIDSPGIDVDASAATKSIVPLTPGTSAGNSLDVLDRRFSRGHALQHLIDLPDLVVFNDEAHHIHDVKKGDEVTEVEWQKSLSAIAAPKGRRFIQFDFSATPYNQVRRGKKRTSQYFSHIVVDFDLNAAMSAGLVKALALDKRREIAALPLDFRAERDERGKAIGLSQGQRVMLQAGLKKLSILEESFAGTDADKHPKLMIVCEDTTVTPLVEEFLISSGLEREDIIAIDSNRKGEMKKSEWEVSRKRLFGIDRHTQPKVIISVLMLREGFDVDNICVIVPLRSSEASILLEQTIGRGLRLMWRGDPAIDELKSETRDRIRQKLEPENFFDVLFVVEHPAFAAFYDQLMDGGLAVGVGDEVDTASATGDIELVGLRNGFEAFDFVVPMILSEAEEELVPPDLDPISLVPCKFELKMLKGVVGKGDQFVSKDAQTGTHYGDYRVEGGVMTATGYNDYLSRMTNRIAVALSSRFTKSQAKYNEQSKFPLIQAFRPQLTGWIDTYIKNRLFDEPFAPLEDENWRVLLIDDVSQDIAGQFATVLVDILTNEPTENARVQFRRTSEVGTIKVRASTAAPATKCIYPKLRVAARAGGLERMFIDWTDSDTSVEAFIKIDEHRHGFLHRPYIKADGMPGFYSPDFLVRTADGVFIVETKADAHLSDTNVRRKQNSAVSWCDQLNALDPAKRSNREWSYVILGESTVKDWRSKGGRVSELLEFAKLRRTDEPAQESMF